MIKKLIILFIFFCFGCNHPESKEYERNNKISTIKNEEIDNSSFFLVTKVIDGDTFYCIDNNNIEYKIRLIGIDTPELRNYGKKKKGYYAIEAKSYLTNLILNQTIRLEYDLDKYDQYNRVLAYAYLKDNTFINAELVKNGFARVMTIQPNSKYSDLFYEQQVNARDKKIGIWDEGN